MIDPYKILKINRSATAEEIKSAYRKLAMQYHPDRRPGDKKAEARFKEIQWAWEILGNAKRKERFDATGDTSEPKTADKEHDDMLSFLITVMHGAMSNLMNGARPESFDVVAEMHKAMATAASIGNQRLSELHRHRKVMADAAQRFVVIEGSEENFLAAAARVKLAEIDAAIPHTESELANLGKAIAYLKKFGYRLDFGRATGVRTLTSMGLPFIIEGKRSGEY